MSRTALIACCLLFASSAARAESLDSATIRKVVQPHVGELQVCFERHLAHDPKARGKVIARFAIGTNGRVTTVTAKGIHASVETCIAAQIKTWRFPAHQGTKPIEVSYPFMFAPTEASPAKQVPAKGTAEGTAAVPVDPRLVALFDKAVRLGKLGKHAEALATYRKVLATQRTQRLAALPRFLATVHLQVSYTLIDLGRLKQAKAELALVAIETLKPPVRYDFYFTRGNVLGGLGELRPMFAAFVEAISTAEDLEDLTVRPPACWTKIIAFTMKAKDWKYLREVSTKALQVAKLRRYKGVELKARLALAEADKHLGK